MADDWFAQNKPAATQGDWFDQNKPQQGMSLEQGHSPTLQRMTDAAWEYLNWPGNLAQAAQHPLQTLSPGQGEYAHTGDIRGLLHAVPLVGPALSQTATNAYEGQWPEFVGHLGALMAGGLRGGAESAAPPAALPAPPTGTVSGAVVPAAKASKGLPGLPELGPKTRAVLGMVSPRGGRAYDFAQKMIGPAESKILPTPPAVPEMNTGGPPIAKYTVVGTANRTPYLANVPKRTAPAAAPADASTAGEGQKYFSSTLHGDIHGLGQQVYGRTGLHQKLHDVAVERYKVDSLKKLSDAQRMDFVDYLKSELEKQLNH